MISQNAILPDDMAMSVQLVHEFTTDIVESASGFEHRNARHTAPRRRYLLDTGPRPISDIQKLMAFFTARRGRHGGFLLRDFLDFHSGNGARPTQGDQKLEYVDEAAHGDKFALIKDYGDSSLRRRICKPQQEGFMLAAAGRLLQPNIDYRLDQENGLVTMLQSNINQHDLTAGFYFHVPVRFDADRLEVQRYDGEMAQISPVPLVEIRPHVEAALGLLS